MKARVVSIARGGGNLALPVHSHHILCNPFFFGNDKRHELSGASGWNITVSALRSEYKKTQESKPRIKTGTWLGYQSNAFSQCQVDATKCMSETALSRVLKEKLCFPSSLLLYRKIRWNSPGLAGFFFLELPFQSALFNAKTPFAQNGQSP